MIKLSFILKNLHRFLFLITFTFVVYVFWILNISNSLNTKEFFTTEPGISIFRIYMICVAFYMYTLIFMIYDAIKRKLKHEHIFLWIIGSIFLPFLVNYFYFEKYIYKSHFFNKDN